MSNRRCLSCKPEGHHLPSGYSWFHEASCARYPKQRVGQERTRAEHQARTLHPAGTDLNVTKSFSKGFDGWHRQPKVGPMTEAVSYVDEHVDDEMDEVDA